MAFSVDDFHDLVRLLEERPEWRAELRRMLLTEELVALPARFAEAQERTEARLEALTAAQERTEARLEALTARVEALAAAQLRTESVLTDLVETVARMGIRLDKYVGIGLELQFRQKAPGYFGLILRRARVLSYDALDDILEPAIEAGVLSRDEAHEVRLADAVVSGMGADDDRLTYFVVEVSATVDASDVDRAVLRASLLGRTGRSAVPVVAGERVETAAESAIVSKGVYAITNGSVRSPRDDAA